MYLHVMVVGNWAVEVIVDDASRQVAGPNAGIGDDGVEVNFEV